MPLFVTGWTEGTWVPTATGITLSAGTITGKYARNGRLILFDILYTFGAGDTFAGVGVPFVFTLPAAASVALPASAIQVVIEDISLPNAGTCVMMGATDTTHTPRIWQGVIQITPTPDTIGPGTWTTNQPWTWAAGDRLTVTGWYYAA